MVDIDEEAVRAKLLRLRQDLEAVRSDSTASRAAVELDQTSVGRVSRIDAIQQQQMALATERNRLRDLDRISTALQRLDDGTYGFCVACDEPIAPRRLAFDPAVPTCIDCAR